MKLYIKIYIIHLNMRDIKKETNQRPRNRNQYLYVRSIGPGCWGTCPTATQGGKWLSRKIPGAALWTSSACTAWRRRPRRIICPSEPFLGDQKWHNRMEIGLDCMEGDLPLEFLQRVLAFSHVTCTRDPLVAASELPCSCRNHSLFHMQWYCHRFAHFRL